MDHWAHTAFFFFSFLYPAWAASFPLQNFQHTLSTFSTSKPHCKPLNLNESRLSVFLARYNQINTHRNQHLHNNSNNKPAYLQITNNAAYLFF